jgi:hypothetical protein
MSTFHFGESPSCVEIAFFGSAIHCFFAVKDRIPCHSFERFPTMTRSLPWLRHGPMTRSSSGPWTPVEIPLWLLPKKETTFTRIVDIIDEY